MHGCIFYPCKQCKITCLSQLHLNWHMGTKHTKRAKIRKKVSLEQTSKLIVCDICGYKPSSNVGLAGMRIHKESVHFGIRYKCLQCQHPCSTKSNLQSHIREKHESKLFQCSSCSFTAKKSYILRDHNSIVHLGIKLFCDTYPCSYSTENIHDLRQHNKSHHGTSSKKHHTRVFNCSAIYATNCETVCKTGVEIEDHYRMIHEGLTYDCLECDYSTMNKKLYDQHNNINHIKNASIKYMESQTQKKTWIKLYMMMSISVKRVSHVSRTFRKMKLTKQ